MDIGKLVGILGGWSVIVVGISAFVGRLITARLISAWDSRQERMTETLRGEMAESLSSLQAAIDGHTGSQGALWDRRAEAAMALWQAVLKMRDDLEFPLFFFGILPPEEYDAAVLGDTDLAGPASSITNQMILDATSIAREIEKDRPLLGEKLWLYFSAYRSFLGRLAILLSSGRDSGHIADWRDDPLINEILETVLSRSAISSLLEPKDSFPSPGPTTTRIESMILSELSRLLSGEISSLESYENSQKLRKLEEDAKRQQSK